MKYEEIMNLIDKINASCLSEFDMQDGEFHLKMKSDKKTVVEKEVIPQVHTTAIQTAPVETGQEPIQEKPVSVSEGNLVKSPLVGTFYSSASPESDPYVSVGDRVSKGQILGIVEAMKLMNEIESEYDGIVEQILVENEGTVEYGQPLFVIR